MRTLQDMAAAAATQYGIPPDIFASLIQQESGWRPDVISSAGAIGPAQLMPGTAEGLGVDPYDPAQNIEGGARYLAQQYERFGSWPLALAAYNAGPGAVTRYGGIPPFAETQAYVPAVLGRVGGTDPMAMTPDPEQQPQGFFGRVGQGLGELFPALRAAPDSSPTDPFEGLSRNQRMMLGFASIRDAAEALQGRQSSHFRDALGGFEEARERERLRAQGQAQSLMNLQQALLFAVATEDEETANLYRNLIAQTRAAMGGTAMPQPAGGVAPPVQPAGGVAPPVQPADGVVPPAPTGQPMVTENQIADLDRRIAELGSEATRQSQMGIGVDTSAVVADLYRQQDLLIEQRAELAGRQEAAAREAGTTESLTLPLIDQSLDFLIEGFDAQGQPIVNPMLTTRAGRISQELIQSPEYQQFLGAIETLRTGTLLEALGEVSVGALSEGERQALSAKLGELDPNNPLGSIDTLRRMREAAEEAMARQRGSGSASGATVNWD